MSIFKNKDKEHIITLIGVVLIKLGTGIIGSWGSNNLYFLSYFRELGYTITPSTNSNILLAIVIPMTFLGILAMKISNYFGYELVIRVCSFIFFLAPFALYIKFSMEIMIVFNLFIPTSAFIVSSIPLLNCLYRHFPNSKNQVMAIVVVAFGVGGIIWNFIFMLLVNPTNQSATVIDNDNKMSFFSPQVTKNVKFSVPIVYMLSGILFVIGSFMVSKKQLPETNQQTNIQNKQIELKQNSPTTDENMLIIQKHSILTLKQSLLDTRFLLIFFISFFMGIYQIYLMLNLKIIYMPIINDDHFLVYAGMVHTVASLVGAFVWGYIGDQKGITFSVLMVSFLDFLCKSYGNIALDKTSLMIFFLVLGFCDKGIVTLVGPGLIQIFGLEMGTQLLPYKGISIILGFVFVPILQLITNGLVSAQRFLLVLTIFSIVALVLALKFSKIKLQHQNKVIKSKQLDNINNDN